MSDSVPNEVSVNINGAEVQAKAGEIFYWPYYPHERINNILHISFLIF